MAKKNQNKAKVIIGVFQSLEGILDGFYITKSGIIKAKPITPRKNRKKAE